MFARLSGAGSTAQGMLKLAYAVLLVGALCRLLDAQIPAAWARDESAPGTASTETVFTERLEGLQRAFAAKRRELGVPGAVLVVVKDGEVFLKAFGERDAASHQPVTPDTLFQIASATKAFTALATMMLVDDKRLSLADPPSKYVPGLRFSDPDINAKITILDLLTHRSGYSRADIAWLLGQKLSRKDLIEGIAQLKPTRKLGAAFQYQNLMYLAAGEAAAGAAGMPYEDLITTRILKPLGMPTATASHADFLSSPDRAHGYEVVAGKATETAIADTTAIAPAAGIAASGRDLAQWLRFLLNSGKMDEKSLITPESLREVFKPQIQLSKEVGYALGWFVRSWNGEAVIEHGGDLPGYSAEIALMPGKHLAFAVLTNDHHSQLRDAAMELVWTYLATQKEIAAGDAEPQPPASPVPVEGSPQEAGTYAFGGVGKDMIVRFSEGQLTLDVSGQVLYQLIPVAGRRYKLSAPAPAGFFANFRPSTNAPGETELFLEQPQGNIVLQKRRYKPLKESQQSESDLIGLYKNKDSGSRAGRSLEIANVGGKLMMLLPGAPAFPMTSTDNDTFSLSGLKPGTVHVLRDEDADVTGLTVDTKQERFEVTGPDRIKSGLSLEDLSALIITAAGGKDRLSAWNTFVGDYETHQSGNGQGITEKGTYAVDGRRIADRATKYAFGKRISSRVIIVDEKSGVEEIEGEGSKPIDPAELATLQIDGDLKEPLDWNSLYKKVRLLGIYKIDEQPFYTVSKLHASGVRVFDYYDVETYRLIRRVYRLPASNGRNVDTIIRFANFRNIQGLWLPFKANWRVRGSGTRTFQRFKTIAVNAEVPKSAFEPLAKSRGP